MEITCFKIAPPYQVTHSFSGKPKDPWPPSPSTKDNPTIEEGEAVIQLIVASLEFYFCLMLLMITPVLQVPNEDSGWSW